MGFRHPNVSLLGEREDAATEAVRPYRDSLRVQRLMAHRALEGIGDPYEALRNIAAEATRQLGDGAPRRSHLRSLG